MSEDNFDVSRIVPASFAGRVNFPDADSPSRVYVMESCFSKFSDDNDKVAAHLESMFRHNVFGESDFNLGFLWWSESRDAPMCDFNGYEYRNGWSANGPRFSWVMEGNGVSDNCRGYRNETGCRKADKGIGIEQFYSEMVSRNEYIRNPPVNSNFLKLGFDL